jgi:NO-binding membrane sensor protein with MHYT domain
VTELEFAFSGVLMGIGIVSMHDTGMAAMRMPAGIHYDPILVTLSVLIAIRASIVAFWLAFRTTTTVAPVSYRHRIGDLRHALYGNGSGDIHRQPGDGRAA